MIKQTYGVTKIPFLQTDYVLLPHQQEIADVINIHAQHGGLCVVTGDPGVGKTVIKQQIEQHATRKDHLIISFSRTMDTYSKILRQMTDSLELGEKGRKIEQEIITTVYEHARSNKTLVTLIDEAHLLDVDSLRRLRLLFDRFPRKHNLVLFGQPELMVRLSLKNNEDIKSRITFSSQLKPLTDEDLMTYIQRELKGVRMPKDCFEDGAIDLILRSVLGNLRLCANLCYGSLLGACRNGERVIDHTHVNAVLIQPHWRSHEDLIVGERRA